MLGLGRWLEKRYPAYARVLYSGGFASAYFVTFATHYIPFTRIFTNPAPTLLLLAAVVAAWAGVAQWRQSRLMAMFVTVLGHLTVLLSTLTLEMPSRFAVAGLVVLCVGSAFFLWRNHWYAVAFIGSAGNYLNYFIWLVKNPTPGTSLDFWAAMGVLTLFYVLFAGAEILSPQPFRRAAPLWFRSLFVTANTAGYFALGTLLVADFPFTEPYQHVFRLALGAALIGFAAGYAWLRERDPLHNVYAAKGAAAVALGLAAWFSGDMLTAWLAIEMVALLYASRQSGFASTRVLAFVMAIVALFHGLYAACVEGVLAYADAGFGHALAAGAVSVAVFYIASIFYQRTDWRTRSTQTLPFGIALNALLWNLDLVTEAPEGRSRKPFDGLLFPYGYAFAGTLLLMVYLHRFIDTPSVPPSAALSALALTACAWVLRSKPMGLMALACGAASLLGGTLGASAGQSSAPAWLGACGLAALALTALASEQQYVKKREGLAFHQAPLAPYLLYGAAAWLTALYWLEHFEAMDDVVLMSLTALALAGLMHVLHPAALAWSAAGLYAVAANCCLSIEPTGLPAAFLPAGMWYNRLIMAFVAAGLAGGWYFGFFKSKHHANGPGGLVLLASWCVALRYGGYLAPDWDWMPAYLLAVPLLYLAYGAALRTPFAFLLSLLAAIPLTAFLLALPLIPPTELYAHAVITALGLAAAFWIAIERLLAFSKKAGRKTLAASGSAVALASLLLAILCSRIPALRDYYLTICWTGLAAALFAVSFAFRQRFYRYAGLGVFALAIVRVVFIDTRQLDAFPRVGAFAVLGGVLLAVAFGYTKAIAHLATPREHQEP